MSIATQTARIKGNVTAAFEAIAEKGVTVPTGSTSDALAALIAAIETESGGSSGGTTELTQYSQGHVVASSQTKLYSGITNNDLVYNLE